MEGLLDENTLDDHLLGGDVLDVLLAFGVETVAFHVAEELVEAGVEPVDYDRDKGAQ